MQYNSISSNDCFVQKPYKKFSPSVFYDEFEVNNPAPTELGLTCTQEGDTPNPVLLHEDLILQDGDETELDLPMPRFSRKLALSIFALNGGAECRFMSKDNDPIPLDVRAFSENVMWEMCAKLFFKNTSGAEAHISVSAVEVL